MPTNIIIPEMGESVRTGVVASWLKKPGEYVNRDDPVMELETDKITMEVRAPVAGALTPLASVGETVPVGAVVGRIDESDRPPAANGKSAAAPVEASAKPAPAPAAPPAQQPAVATASEVRATPLARKVAEQHAVDLAKVKGTGAGGRIREQDVMAAIDSKESSPAAAPPIDARAASGTPSPASTAGAGTKSARRERMSPLRQRIAARLVEAQHTAAMLTTFNEVDMTAVMDLRKKYKEAFEKKHGIGLGFMPFFVKAVVQALRAFPAVNASIVQGDGGAEVEYHDYCDIAVAVGTPKGLVVPVLRGCESLSFAAIESGVKDLATRARDGKLSLDDLQGGTFTITNGGIYGSLMSTPILNPPQSGILGMHAIKSRAVEHPSKPGEVAIRPMMYLALSYDHRLIDGSEAVQFLVTVKNAIEQPERLLLEV
ncbi:MAG: 2-oxoglutarate dehydrogenase complex dihydrolipoyllysine-residue succinyltransferase [Phycisphaeraceae bacterium]|nr:2-oxoglutarate dehydrogenase complex dihydrolipoyllysine-residue succinyltransferase [Phycisphaeraceae bacterium]